MVSVFSSHLRMATLAMSAPTSPALDFPATPVDALLAAVTHCTASVHDWVREQQQHLRARHEDLDRKELKLRQDNEELEARRAAWELEREALGGVVDPSEIVELNV